MTVYFITGMVGKGKIQITISVYQNPIFSLHFKLSRCGYVG